MAKTIVRKTTAESEIPPMKAEPQVERAIDRICAAIGVAALLAASDEEVEGTKSGTVQFAGEALLVLLDQASAALAPDDLSEFD